MNEFKPLNVSNTQSEISKISAAKLREMDNELRKNIMKLQTETDNKKKEYYKSLNGTYNNLISQFNDKYTEHDIELTIEGIYSSCYIRPSEDYWKKCNSIKTEAINIFLQELNKNKISYAIGVSTFYRDREDNSFYGGEILSIICTRT